MKLFPQQSFSNDSGFTTLESLIVLVLIGIAAAGSTAMFTVALRGLQGTRQTYAAQAAIEANKAQIDDLARKFTCCSGICTTTSPTSTTSGPSKACATTSPNDDRYYFPQLDDPTTTTNFPGTTTPSEPNAVDQLCDNTNNTVFLTPLKTAIDGLAQPSPATRSSAQILSYKMLRVDFTDPSAGIVVRSIYVKPRMANFCS